MAIVPTLQELTDMLSLLYSTSKARVKQPENKECEVDETKLLMLAMVLPLPKDIINVVLKPSPVHGRGVFANKDIQAGSIVTFYPGDIVKFYLHDNMNEDKHIITPSFSIRFILKFNLNVLSDEELPLLIKEELKNNMYEYELDRNYKIASHSSLDDNPWYLGHFINDKVKYENTLESAVLYLQHSSQGANCKYHTFTGNLHVAIVATRDIMEGEELFITYGLKYWSIHE